MEINLAETLCVYGMLLQNPTWCTSALTNARKISTVSVQKFRSNQGASPPKGPNGVRLLEIIHFGEITLHGMT